MEKLVGLLQPLVEDQRSLLIGLGAAIFVIGLAGGVPPYLPIPAGPPQIGVAVFGGALAIVGIYLVLGGGTSRPYGVEIWTPENDSSVPETGVVVKGAVRRLPAGKELWLVRMWGGDRYYPQKKVALEKGQKVWTEKIDFNRAEGLGAFVIGEEGQALIEYQREAADRHRALFTDYEELLRKHNMPKDEKNRYLPSFKRSTVKALKIKECHIIRLRSL